MGRVMTLECGSSADEHECRHNGGSAWEQHRGLELAGSTGGGSVDNGGDDRRGWSAFLTSQLASPIKRLREIRRDRHTGTASCMAWMQPAGDEERASSHF
ncbi:hypothetical protein PCANC_20514 [Puccinia coronata f. sp. avenae]|uniref:Uncharacterized protein n=1 Tax=Puccinia coronata f. sp. avenae TaxID=200324 RepID=A0A2N5SCS5_9BASI|nr:hypothetical protein PCANC_20514 [Puccinia coronata f. sp. avenae]PLW39946.1 hypothetical protein PCASD_06831 [Puccinia coronata f. sp. avenae]